MNERKGIGQQEEASLAVQNFIDQFIVKIKSEQFRRDMLSTVMSIIMALLVAAVLMVATGHDPAQAYGALFIGAVMQFDQVLYQATALTLAGLSVALAFRCGLFNIGAEGQIYIGSIVATAVGYMIALPIVVHQLACLIIGAIAGMLYGLLPGLLKAYRGAHEVVTTMMLSYAAVLLTQWLVSQGPMHNPGDWRSVSPFILPTAELPKILGSSFLNVGFIIAVLCVIGVDFFINRTVMGYEMRAVGSNEEAARTAGINTKRNMALALAISGGLAGLAGAEEIMGYYHRFYDGWSAGRGFDGITVAVLGRNNAWGVFAAGIFFGLLKAGGGNMQTFAGVPSEMVNVIQGLVVLFIAAPRLVDWLAGHGSKNAIWLKETPHEALPHITALVFSIVMVTVGIALIGVSGTYSVAMVILAIACISGLFSTVYFFKQDEFGQWALAITSIVWLILTMVYLGVSSSLAIMSGIIGIIGLVLFVILLSKAEDTPTIQEVEV